VVKLVTKNSSVETNIDLTELCDMTEYQYNICQKVVKYKNMDRILKECGFPDYIDLYNVIGITQVIISDANMDEHTIVTLEEPLMEEFEKLRKNKRQNLVSLILTVYTAIMTSIATAISISELLR